MVGTIARRDRCAFAPLGLSQEPKLCPNSQEFIHLYASSRRAAESPERFQLADRAFATAEHREEYTRPPQVRHESYALSREQGRAEATLFGRWHSERAPRAWH